MNRQVLCCAKNKLCNNTKAAPAMKQLFQQPENLPFLEIRTTLESVMPYDAHFHMGFSMGVILENKTCTTINEIPYIAQKNDLVLIMPEQVHSCNSVDGLPRGYHMLFFESSWFNKQVIRPVWKNCKLRLKNPVISSPVLFSKVTSLIADISSGTERTEKMLAALLVSALKQAKAEPLPKNASYRGKAGLHINTFLQPASCIKNCSISHLAQKAKMRRETFSRSFRRRTGLLPKDYIHCLRIEKGRHLLRQGKSISDAALEAGYTDQSHFHRMFVRKFSVTPGVYQKNQSHLYKK